MLRLSKQNLLTSFLTSSKVFRWLIIDLILAHINRLGDLIDTLEYNNAIDSETAEWLRKGAAFVNTPGMSAQWQKALELEVFDNVWEITFWGIIRIGWFIINLVDILGTQNTFQLIKLGIEALKAGKPEL